MGRHARPRGQALVEFAIALPILILLVAGTIELGRGYVVATATSDAARDGARYAAGKAGATTNGPGLAAMCSLIKADLAGITKTVSCPAQAVTHLPPFNSPADFAQPATGQAVFAAYCGGTLTCAGATASWLYGYEVDVYVYYRFSDLNLLGGGITIPGSSQMTTSW